eukprot:g3181.t1
MSSKRSPDQNSSDIPVKAIAGVSGVLVAVAAAKYYASSSSSSSPQVGSSVSPIPSPPSSSFTPVTTPTAPKSSTTTVGSSDVSNEIVWNEILAKAKNRALKGGKAGMAAMFLQVATLMWMRTTMNYQYRYGTSTFVAIRTLYAQGGIPRFYAGVGPALFQGPLSRFGDTAANEGAKVVMNTLPQTRDLPTPVKTFASSIAAASWRIFLMPIDACKTIMQVEGKGALGKLAAKVGKGGPQVLWHGSLGACGATFVGHYPWFATYNTLDSNLPQAEGKWQKLGRRAAIGFCSSVVSDCTSNSVRVVKAVKQTSTVPISYPDAVKMVYKDDGLAGLFGRGLQTRIMANGLQGCLFVVLFKGFMDYMDKRDEEKK